MTHDAVQHPRWSGEALAEVLGRELARLGDDAWVHEPFLTWLAADVRAQAERRDRTLRDEEDHLRGSGRALRVRLLARQCGIEVVPASPRLIAPLVRGTPSQVLRDARAAGAVARVELAAAAGSGRELWDEPAEHWVALPMAAVPRRAIALRIAGDSMMPLLRSGDTVLLELTPTLVRGRVVVARNGDDGYVCKRVDKVGRREVVLSSLNPEFGPVTIARDERLVVGTVRMVWRG